MHKSADTGVLGVRGGNVFSKSMGQFTIAILVSTFCSVFLVQFSNN